MAQPSLLLAHAACDVALGSLLTPSDIQPPQLNVIYTDLLSLLSLVYADTTKLSLALKPSSPTHSAALRPLKDISDHITALSHCARLFQCKNGLTLSQEISAAARDVITSVKALLQLFLDIEASKIRTSTGKAGDYYMMRTAAVHEIITNARSGLSKNNIAAVHKKLTVDHASLADALEEVDGMASNQESADDYEDDGWSELGLDSKTRMTAKELERTKKAHAIFRLSTLFHKRIIKDILTPPSGSELNLSSHLVENLDSLPSQSSSLLIASDELVATLYAPQTPSDISSELAAFVAVIDGLQSTVLKILQEPSLAEQIQLLSLQAPVVPQKDPRGWFQTCFTQIQKAAVNLQSILNTDG